MVKFLKQNDIKFFYTILFESNINVIKIRILEENFEILNEYFIKNNNIKISVNNDYRPEILRYGGKENIYQIEEIFCKASFLQSEILFKENFLKKILLVLELNKNLFNFIDISSEEIKKIYLFLSQMWMEYAKTNFGIEIKNIKNISENLFDDIIKEEIEINKNELNDYIYEVKKIKKLNYINTVYETPKYSENMKEILEKMNINKTLFNILISLAHMNFNRLELYPHLECVVYRILSENEF